MIAAPTTTLSSVCFASDHHHVCEELIPRHRWHGLHGVFVAGCKKVS
jgi:hypothetical protein